MPPDYIVANWTDEMLVLMIEKLVERKQRINDAIRGNTSSHAGDTVVSDTILFQQLGSKLKVVKHD